jgi:hypothetical protein
METGPKLEAQDWRADSPPKRALMGGLVPCVMLAAQLFAQADAVIPFEAPLQKPDDKIEVRVSSPDVPPGRLVFRGTVCSGLPSGDSIKWVSSISGEITNESPMDFANMVVVFHFRGERAGETATAEYESLPKDLPRATPTKLSVWMIVLPQFRSCGDIRSVSVSLSSQELRRKKVLAEFEARYAAEREVQVACHSLFVRLADLKMSEVSVKDNTAMELCKKVGLFN